MTNLLYNPRVFISHSAKEEGARKLCESIAAGLRAADFEVLWDADLPTAEKWRGAIDEWIWNCDAAILVLSQNAVVESKYVAYEAALLRQRWLHMKPQFLLIPVWCPGVGNELLVKNMGALQIAEIHTNVKIKDWPAKESANPFAAEVQSIVTELTKVRENSGPRHELEDLLMSELEQGSADDNALAAVAKAYQLPALPPGAKKDRVNLLARMLIDSKEALGDPRFQQLRNGIPKMMAVLTDSKDRVPRIIKLVAPFCWVSPDCVARIPALLLQPAGGLRALAWVRKWHFSERMYLNRTYCTRLKVHVVSASEVTGGGIEELFNHILACLGDKVCNDPFATEARVGKRIKTLSDLGQTVFLILSADGITNELLNRICSTWPSLCVFLYTGKMNQQQLRLQFPNVQIVEPELVEDDEADARSGWRDCMVLAGWSSQQVQNVEEFN